MNQQSIETSNAALTELGVKEVRLDIGVRATFIGLVIVLIAVILVVWRKK